MSDGIPNCYRCGVSLLGMDFEVDARGPVCAAGCENVNPDPSPTPAAPTEREALVVWLNRELRHPEGRGVGDIAGLILAAGYSREASERVYPCADCGVLRSKDEGGTTFTVCDECWDKHFHPEKSGAVLRGPSSEPPKAPDLTEVKQKYEAIGLQSVIALIDEMPSGEERYPQFTRSYQEGYEAALIIVKHRIESWLVSHPERPPKEEGE